MKSISPESNGENVLECADSIPKFHLQTCYRNMYYNDF